MRCSPSQEKRRIIRTWRLRMAGPPVQPCSSSTGPTAFSLVEQPLHPHGRMSWPSDIWHPDPHTTPAKTLQPHPQTSLQLPTPKMLHHHWPKPSLQYFGLLLRDGLLWWVYTGKNEVPGILGTVTKSQLDWGSCHFYWSFRQERLFLLSPLAFLVFLLLLLHCIPT